MESPQIQHYVGFIVCIEQDSGIISLGTTYILHERREGRGETFSSLEGYLKPNAGDGEKAEGVSR